MARSVLEQLVVELTTDNTRLRAGLREAETATSSSAGRLRANARAIGTAIGATTAAITAVSGALIAATSRVAAYADEIDKASIRTRLSRGAVQELRFVTDQLGGSFSVVETAVTGLTRRLAGAEQGSERQTQAFSRLGVTLRDNAGQLRSTEELLFDSITALQGVANETERAVLAQEVFGRSAADLAPILAAGAGSVEELRARARELGLVLDDQAVGSLVEYKDQLSAAQQQFAALSREVVLQFLPIVTNQLLPAFERAIGVFRGLPEPVQRGASALTGFAGAVGAVTAALRLVGVPLAGLFGPAGLVIAGVGVAASLAIAFSGRRDSLDASVKNASDALASGDRQSLVGALAELESKVDSDARPALARLREDLEASGKIDATSALGALDDIISKADGDARAALQRLRADLDTTEKLDVSDVVEAFEGIAGVVDGDVRDALERLRRDLIQTGNVGVEQAFRVAGALAIENQQTLGLAASSFARPQLAEQAFVAAGRPADRERVLSALEAGNFVEAIGITNEVVRTLRGGSRQAQDFADELERVAGALIDFQNDAIAAVSFVDPGFSTPAESQAGGASAVGAAAAGAVEDAATQLVDVASEVTSRVLGAQLTQGRLGPRDIATAVQNALQVSVIESARRLDTEARDVSESVALNILATAGDAVDVATRVQGGLESTRLRNAARLAAVDVATQVQNALEAESVTAARGVDLGLRDVAEQVGLNIVVTAGEALDVETQVRAGIESTQLRNAARLAGVDIGTQLARVLEFEQIRINRELAAGLVGIPVPEIRAGRRVPVPSVGITQPTQADVQAARAIENAERLQAVRDRAALRVYQQQLEALRQLRLIPVPGIGVSVAAAGAIPVPGAIIETPQIAPGESFRPPQPSEAQRELIEGGRETRFEIERGGQETAAAISNAGEQLRFAVITAGATFAASVIDSIRAGDFPGVIEGLAGAAGSVLGALGAFGSSLVAAGPGAIAGAGSLGAFAAGAAGPLALAAVLVPIFGGILASLFRPSRRPEQRLDSRAAGAVARGAPAIELNLQVFQNIGTLGLDPASRSQVDSFLNETVERVQGLLERVVLPRLDRVEARVEAIA